METGTVKWFDAGHPQHPELVHLAQLVHELDDPLDVAVRHHEQPDGALVELAGRAHGGPPGVLLAGRGADSGPVSRGVVRGQIVALSSRRHLGCEAERPAYLDVREPEVPLAHAAGGKPEVVRRGGYLVEHRLLVWLGGCRLS